MPFTAEELIEMQTCKGILQRAWKLGHELTILSVSVDIKFVISPKLNVFVSSVDVTLSVFLRIVETIAPCILMPICDISQLNWVLNRADTSVAPRSPPAYMYLGMKRQC